MLERKIFEQTCRNHYFELEIARLHKEKQIYLPIYLSLGTEHIPPAIAATDIDWRVFPQHRCHSYFLSFGGDPLALMKELLGRKDGCNGGMGGSASVSVLGKVFGHDGLLGSQIPLGTGYAHASNLPTLIIGGDAAYEEDFALAALGYAITNKVPTLFICEDNNLSILTDKATRRSWDIVKVAKGFGLPAEDIEDDPVTIHDAVIRLSKNLPALLNIRCCRHYWHAGSGQDSSPPYDRFAMMRKPEYSEMETKIKEEMESLCHNLENS